VAPTALVTAQLSRLAHLLPQQRGQDGAKINEDADLRHLIRRRRRRLDWTGRDGSGRVQRSDWSECNIHKAAQ